MRFFLTILILISAAANTQAAQYKYTNENGVVSFTDKPPYAGAEEMSPPQLQTTPAVKYKPKPKPVEAPTIETIKIKYLTFEINSPKNNETIRSNNGDISILIKLIPELSLKDGHYINIYLDNKLVKKHIRTYQITLNNIDRGSHNIKAVIKDTEGKIIKTSSNTLIHLHRFSALHNKPNQMPLSQI